MSLNNNENPFKTHPYAYEGAFSKVEGISTQYSHQFTTAFDREFHARLGKFYALSPASLAGAYFDWFTHLSISPGKQLQLIESALRKGASLIDYTFWSLCGISTDDSIDLVQHDRRFADRAWQTYPFNIYHQAFLLTQQWWEEATSTVRGVDQHHSEVLPFLTRQYLDMWAPLNFPFTNPQVVETTICLKGLNLVRGAQHLVEDTKRALRKEPPAGMEKFKVGKNLAVTPGKVIYQNRLIELIQYSPVTEDVYAEPILIIPAWIMKYYILDLSQNNSLVKYLVENNHTVFMISWKNPGSEDRDLGFDDYLKLGIMDALNAISTITPKEKIHAVGYCLGGTLLSIAAAAMAREGDDRLKTVTLFASQVDYEEAGELLLFIDESQITFLEDVMWDRGYLDSSRLAGTFDMLRSYDLIWSKGIEKYYLGKRYHFTDLMAWNADATRLPYKMHSEYLRKLFLHNQLSNGKFTVRGRPIALNDIKAPIFSVATQKDHISPWKSVFKLHLFTDTEITFLLTSGGHNAGIVSELGHPNRSYQVSTHKKKAKHLFPEEWQATTPQHEGSWWPVWEKWLADHSGKRVPPPATDLSQKGYKILRNAPGIYVMEK
ncbi:MAG: alpha/beta fold hydrolase [Alphaproteobacteria bacterium]|nr:alpha/beta fold hydrolase [Alphaproteobacteria bacterium]